MESMLSFGRICKLQLVMIHPDAQPYPIRAVRQRNVSDWSRVIVIDGGKDADTASQIFIVRNVQVIVIMRVIQADQAGHLLEAFRFKFNAGACGKCKLLPTSSYKALSVLRA
ncbi:hypothetical protein D3C73_1240690 [compost metagenome]